MPQAVQTPARFGVEILFIHAFGLLDCTSTTFVGRTAHSHPLFPIALPQLSQGRCPNPVEGTPETKCPQATSCRGAFQTCTSLPTTRLPFCPPDSNPCTRVSHHNRASIYQALQGGTLREPGHAERPSSLTIPKRVSTPQTRWETDDPIDEEGKTWEFHRPSDGPWQSRGKGQKADSPGPMSCRGLSHRELHTPDSSLHVQLLAPM